MQSNLRSYLSNTFQQVKFLILRHMSLSTLQLLNYLKPTTALGLFGGELAYCMTYLYAIID